MEFKSIGHVSLILSISGPLRPHSRKYHVRNPSYSNAEKQRSTKIVRVYFVLGILALIANALINMMEVGDTFWIGFLKGLTFALALGAMILGILYTTGAMMKIQAFKMRLIGKEVTK